MTGGFVSEAAIIADAAAVIVMIVLFGWFHYFVMTVQFQIVVVVGSRKEGLLFVKQRWLEWSVLEESFSAVVE